MNNLTDLGFQLLIKEFEALKKELSDAVQESRVVERNSLVASGVLWAWLLSQSTLEGNFGYIKYLPLILCVFGGIRSLALHIRLIRISRYFRELEAKTLQGKFINWESYLHKQGWWLTATSVTYWITIIAGNSFGAFSLIKTH
jgi:hypothetical protein